MTTLALRPSAGPATGKRGPALGLALSVLVHALVLAWLTRLPPPRANDDAPVARIQVRLAPPRPARPVQPDAPEARAAPAEAAAPTAAAPHQPAVRHPPHARTATPAHARASAPPAILALPPASAPDVPAVPPAGASAPAAETMAPPVVDLEAARQAARRIAREDGRNLVSLPARKPVVDPNADRQVIDPIENARRADCKTAYAGMGILALIPLAKDAITGTGCKW